VNDQIMPALSKLLLSGVNPRAVIVKRDSKSTDYTRYLSLREARRPIDKVLLQSASDFVAIHTQLVEELPGFLEGYMRILDLVTVAFAKAQARYYREVRDRLSRFARDWVLSPRRKSGNVIDLDDTDLRDGRGIIQAWHDAWAPCENAMEHFQCTKLGELCRSCQV
jgi:hypothetical protein